AYHVEKHFLLPNELIKTVNECAQTDRRRLLIDKHLQKREKALVCPRHQHVEALWKKRLSFCRNMLAGDQIDQIWPLFSDLDIWEEQAFHQFLLRLPPSHHSLVLIEPKVDMIL
ncbi:MAG: hypothetical protein Q9224_007318, partial [Gallowayella concinna]